VAFGGLWRREHQDASVRRVAASDDQAVGEYSVRRDRIQVRQADLALLDEAPFTGSFDSIRERIKALRTEDDGVVVLRGENRYSKDHQLNRE
jgi:hypothetical protein